MACKIWYYIKTVIFMYCSFLIMLVNFPESTGMTKP